MKNSKQETPKGFYDESNRIIAEFMGLRTNSYGDYNIDKDVMGFDMIVCSLADTKFHTSWDWLMPVVEKCFEVAYDGQMVDIMHHLQVADIERTYDEVVGFIMKYTNYTPDEQ